MVCQAFEVCPVIYLGVFAMNAKKRSFYESLLLACTLVFSLGAYALDAPPPSVDRAREGISESDQQLMDEATSQGAVQEGDEMVFPSGARVTIKAVAPLAVTPNCPPINGRSAVCLYEHENFAGRRLRWSAAGTRIPSLGAFNFNDQMTSWANTGPRDARWFVDNNFSGGGRCMDAHTSNANVGPANNDKASSLSIYANGRSCGLIK